MKMNKFNPVLEAIPNKSSYSPSALFGHSIRMMLDNSANAEVQFQEPKDGGVLDVLISCSDGYRCQVVCHIQKDSLNIDFSAADEKAPASKAQFPAPVLRPEELKSVRIPTDEEWDAFMDVTGENNDLANWKNIYSWTLGVGKLASPRAVRGWVSARYWYHYFATTRSVHVGFRPAFEPLNPDSLVSGQRVVVGTLYMDGKPVAVPKNPVCDGDILNYIPGATLEMREALDDPDFQVQTIKVGDILVCDRNLLKMISWTDIENQGFCPGHPQKLCPEDIKTVRIPTDEEWDAFMDVTDENNDLANWRDMLSWTLNADKPASYRAVRGYYSARYWDPDTATYRSVSVGFRPAFESLSSDRLEDGQCIIVGTLYMDGKPVPVPKSPVCDGDIMDYIPGATLEMREALDDPDFQVQAIKVGNVLVCDRNLLKMISWADIENQGFCPGHPQKLCPEDIKTARIPTDEEWDWFMDVTGENNDLANWKDMFSWTLGVGKLASNRAVRGWVSARHWNHISATLRYVRVGFRPAFEPLNPDSLVSGQRVVVGTLYMDGKPVAVPKNPVCDGDILNYIPGATLEMREALDDPDFQVQTIKVGDILVCDRNLLKMISWTDIENQGFCPGGVADDCKYCSGKTRMSFRCDVRTLRDDGIVEDIPVPSTRCPYCGRILEKGVS